jgi:WD40 repeat protein
VTSLAFANGGSILVSGGADWNVTTWDVKTGRPFGPPRVHDHAAVNGVAVSPDGKTLASAGSDRLVKLWPLEANGALGTTVGGLSPQEASHGPAISDLAVGAGGVAAAAESAGALIWSLHRAAGAQHAPQPLTQIPVSPEGWTYAVAYHGDILAASRGPFFKLWNTGSSCPRMPNSPCHLDEPTNPFQSGPISSLAFAGSGNLLVSGGFYSSRLNLWDVSNPERVERVWTGQSGGSGINELAFSPTSPLVAVAGLDGKIQIWNVYDPHHPSPVGKPLEGHAGQPVTSLAFSPDGKLLASGGQDQRVVLWQVPWDEAHQTATVSRIPSTLSQTQTIFALAFSPDGNTLAVGDGDGEVCLYDVESGRSIGGNSCLLGHYSPTAQGVESIQFVDDGTSLLTAGDGNPIVAWDSILWSQKDDNQTAGALSADVCALAGRNLTANQWDEIFAGTTLAEDRHQTCADYPLDPAP